MIKEQRHKRILAILSKDGVIDTAALARVDLPIDSWAEAAFGSGTLGWLCTPKLLERFGADQERR